MGADSVSWTLEGSDEHGWNITNGDITLEIHGTKEDAEFLLQALMFVEHNIHLPAHYY